MPPIHIDRCVCYDTTFAAIEAWARVQSGVVTKEDVHREFGCGGGCKLCQPYIACTLRTGQVVFEEIRFEEESG
ncbi:MAG: (2Fe-2S)-binding protein [Planctomycetota bacterium]|nr:(2Fe-2S)-binding protein [Planctomycetota bacterium]MDA1261546.1 (2Fe-2S)-binding protein [Planctomycetota bacterium]